MHGVDRGDVGMDQWQTPDEVRHGDQSRGVIRLRGGQGRREGRRKRRPSLGPVGRSIRLVGYPLTAPAVRPARILRWKMRTSTTKGIVTITEAARMLPHGSSYWVLPVKLAIAGWTVRARVWVNVRA